MNTNLKTNKYKKSIMWVGSFVLLFSVVLNIVLYKEMMKYYKSLYSTELDPLGLSYFQNQTNELSTDTPTVVFLGDSRAAQWTTPTVNGFAFINRGIGNQTSAQVANRFDAHVKPLKPQIIIIQIGINDLKTIPLFPEKKQEIIENCEANIQRIVQDSLDINATVILTTIFPTSENVPLARRLVWSDDIYQATDEVNAYITSLAGDNVITFDTANLLSNAEGKIKPEYSFDLLHLNGDGYQVINLELEKILKSIE